jgi:hypothetical protein
MTPLPLVSGIEDEGRSSLVHPIPLLSSCRKPQLTNGGHRDRRFVLFVDYSFIFAGIGSFSEHLFISGARNIRTANQAGMRKMLRNLSTYRQSLKVIDVIVPSEVDLKTATAYYSLFPLGPTVRGLASVLG